LGFLLPAATASGRAGRLEETFLLGHNGIDGRLEDFVYTRHLLRRALHVEGAHLLGNGLALGDGDWS